jgi:hypothetical protein
MNTERREGCGYYSYSLMRLDKRGKVKHRKDPVAEESGGRAPAEQTVEQGAPAADLNNQTVGGA